MEANALHELTPAYALDALSADEEREYEAHLARCEHCRSELTSLSEAATSLAYGIESPPLPPHFAGSSPLVKYQTQASPMIRETTTKLMTVSWNIAYG